MIRSDDALDCGDSRCTTAKQDLRSNGELVLLTNNSVHEHKLAENRNDKQRDRHHPQLIGRVDDVAYY